MFSNGAAKNGRDRAIFNVILQSLLESFQSLSYGVRVAIIVFAQKIPNVIRDLSLEHLVFSRLFFFSQRIANVFRSFRSEVSAARATHMPSYAESRDCSW